MKAATKITITDDNGIKFFGEGPCRLLRCVEKTGSLRAAALEMEMAYSKASKLLKQAEATLGFPLTRRSAGGKDGGGSILTPEGKRWLQQYEAYRDERIAALCREQNVDVVLHALPHRSDTVRLGLQALGELDACMFLPGDQPLLRRETVAMLLECRNEHPDCIIRPGYEDTEGSPVLFPSWAFPELLDLPEGKGGGVVIKNHLHAVYRVSVADPFELADADTPEMLETLKGLCHD